MHKQCKTWLLLLSVSDHPSQANLAHKTFIFNEGLVKVAKMSAPIKFFPSTEFMKFPPFHPVSHACVSHSGHEIPRPTLLLS